MSFQIGKNQNMTLSSMATSGLNIQKTDRSIEKMASGESKKVDDASLSMISQFSSGMSSAGQSLLNANESIGMLQIADNALQISSSAFQDMRDIAVRAASGLFNDNGLENLQKQMNSLISSSDKVISSAQYNGKNLLDGSFSGNTENSALFSKDMRTSTILKDGLDVSTPEAARKSIEKIQLATESLDNARNDFGSSQNKLSSEVIRNSFFEINSASSKSNIKDVDFALESANFSNSKLLQQSGSFALAQQNVSSSSVLALLG